jgi:hypothetical protein
MPKTRSPSMRPCGAADSGIADWDVRRLKQSVSCQANISYLEMPLRVCSAIVLIYRSYTVFRP